MIYLIILIILGFLACRFDFGRNKKGEKFAFLFALLILILLSGLRYRIGFDTIRYMKVFENTIPTFSDFDISYIFINRHEPFFLLLEIFAKSIYSEFTSLQILQATILNISVFFFLRNNTRYLFTGILFYYIVVYASFNFETIRQSTSVAIFLFAVHYLKSRNWVKYYVLCTIAVFFHVSAVILFIVPILPRIIKYKYITLYLILAVIISILISDYFSSIIGFISITERLAMKAAGYANDLSYTGQRLNILGVITHCIINILIPLYFLFIDRRRNPLYKFKFDYFVITYVIVSTLMIKVQLFYRLLDYFYPFLLLLFANTLGNFIVNRKKTSLVRFFSQILLITFITFKIYGQFFGTRYGIKNYHRYYPYSTVLSKKEDPTREVMFWRDLTTN